MSAVKDKMLLYERTLPGVVSAVTDKMLCFQDTINRLLLLFLDETTVSELFNNILVFVL